MSRIGNMPITVPAGVTVTIGENNEVTVKGPKGELKQQLPAEIIIEQNGDTIEVKRPSENKTHKSLHGLTRTLLNNMVVGVTEGYKKELQINGVGYRAAMQGNKLVMNLGYSHQVEMEAGEGLTIEVPQPNQIIVSGADKQKVGQLAAIIREKRPPEPYKGKGIKYVEEHIRRKEGKAGSQK
ncbi:MAG: 50S ribosomal protein L6 [Clostridia bacterium]|nr:50S ribosomal protein L6 [Clostridia bacterium]